MEENMPRIKLGGFLLTVKDVQKSKEFYENVREQFVNGGYIKNWK